MFSVPGLSVCDTYRLPGHWSKSNAHQPFRAHTHRGTFKPRALPFTSHVGSKCWACMKHSETKAPLKKDIYGRILSASLPSSCNLWTERSCTYSIQLGCGKSRFSSQLWSTDLNQTQQGFEIRSPIPLRKQPNTRLLTFWSACLGLFFHR